MTFWIVGPVAWDSVVYVPEFLKPGAFTQGTRFIERTGGTGANVARALCTASVDTGFVGYLGNDPYANILEEELKTSQINKLAITKIQGPTSHVLILVDNSGDRTILGLAADHLDQVGLEDVPLEPGDTVVFVLWREHFIKDLEIAKSKNCNVVVGLDAINDALVSGVTLAIGSHNDVSSDFNPADYLDRFEKIVVTKGAEGATEFSKEAVVQQPALAAQVIDATGAGDAFLAGYLAAMAKNFTVAEERLALAAKWAAKTIATESSVPPPFGTLNVD